MRFLSRSTPAFALLFLLAFGCVAQAQNSNKRPLTFEVASPLALTEKPLALQVRKGRWFPVAITLANSGEPVQGRLTLKTTTATQRNRSATTYFADVDLPTNARKRIWLYGRIQSEDVNAFTVTFQGRGFKGMKADGLLQVASPQTRLLLTISDSDEKLSYLAGLKGAGLGLPDEVGSTPGLYLPPGAGTQNPNLNVGAVPVRPLGAPHDLIPSRWIGLDAIDLVVLQDFPHTALTPKQIATLRGYAAGGGALLALGGANWQRLSTSPLADLWPVAPQSSGTATTADRNLLINRFARFPVMTGADRLGGAPVMVTRGNLKKGNRVLLGSKTAPLLAANDFGAGQVLFLAIDPTQPPFLGWRGLERMWPDIFRPTARPAQIASIGEKPFDEDDYRYGYQYQYGRNQVNASDGLLESLKTSKQLKTPPVSAIAWFLALYVFFLVPMNYVVLRFFDRRELAWLTIPVIVVAFSVMSYAAALKIKGTAILTRQVNIIQTSDGSNLARADAMLWLFSPRKTTYDISSRDPQMALGDYLSDNNVSVEIREPEENQAFALDGAPINMWDWRSFVGHSVADMKGGVSVAIQKDEVGIANNSPFDLKGAVLVSGGSVLGFGTVEAGSTSFNGKSDGINIANAQLVGRIRNASRLESELPGNQVGGFQTIPDKLLQTALARDWSFRDGSTPGTFIVAWSDKPFAGLTIGREDDIAQNLTLLVVRIENKTAIRAALFDKRATAVNKEAPDISRVRRLSYEMLPYQKNRQAGAVSTYEAELKNVSAQRVSLAVKLALENQYGYGQAAVEQSIKTPTVEFFDFSTGAWRSVPTRDLVAEKYAAEKAKNPKAARNGRPLTWELRVLLSPQQTRAFVQQPDGRLQFRVRTYHDGAQVKEVEVMAKSL
jgi:hypothetical protein